MVKVVKDQRDYFVILDRSFIQNSKLSWKARGIFAYLWSQDESWNFYEKEVVKHSIDGRSSLRSGLKELENFGYLERSRERDKKTQQVKESVWILHEKPMFDFPTLEKPTLDNRTLISNNLNKQQQECSSSIPAEKSAEKPVEVPEPKKQKVKDPESEDLKAADQKSFETKPEIKSPWDLWQANWGFPNSIAQQDLVEWTKQFSNELVYHAIEYALKSNVSAKGADRYLERVFDSYEKNKIDSVAKALEQEEQHYQQKTREYNDKKSYGKRSSRPVYQKEQLPDWAKKGYQAPEKSTEEQEHKAQLQAEIKRRLAEIKADKDGEQNVANSQTTE